MVKTGVIATLSPQSGPGSEPAAAAAAAAAAGAGAVIPGGRDVPSD